MKSFSFFFLCYIINTWNTSCFSSFQLLREICYCSVPVELAWIKKFTFPNPSSGGSNCFSTPADSSPVCSSGWAALFGEALEDGNGPSVCSGFVRHSWLERGFDWPNSVWVYSCWPDAWMHSDYFSIPSPSSSLARLSHAEKQGQWKEPSSLPRPIPAFAGVS